MTSTRTQALYDAKLRALVRGHFGDGALEGAVQAPFPGGSTLRNGTRAWVLAEEQPGRALGAALTWAGRHGVEDLHVLVGDDAGRQARRAGYFRHPPRVWSVAGTGLVRALPTPAEAPLPAPPEVRAWATDMARAGAEPVEEHGLLLAEVLGLEVGRVVLQDGAARLLVGVGKHDREAHQGMAGRDPATALSDAVREVRRHRLAGESGHPADQLAPEGWLRSAVLAAPVLVGARRLERFPRPFLPNDLRERVPAPAIGEDADGARLLVVCSTGIDTELVPAAADLRAVAGSGVRLVIAVPAGDEAPVTTRLAAELAVGAEVRTVTRRWRDVLLGSPPVA